MSYRSASLIADYLTAGFYADMGYEAGPFRASAGDALRVFVDLSAGIDRQIIDLALDAWTMVTGFRFVLDGTGNDHDLWLTDADAGAYSYSYHAGNGARLSAVVNVGQDWLGAYGGETVSYYTQTWIHEIGHALGLGHAGPYNDWADWGDQRFDEDSWLMSVMSYFSPAENPNVTASPGFLLTPMPADILAIQRLYGVPDGAGTGAGDDIYGFGGTAGGAYRRFGDLLDAGKLDRPILLTICDSGGDDVLDLSRSDRNQRIDLAPGAFSDVLGWKNTLAIAYGTIIEVARGGGGDDGLSGNDAANRLWGNGGADQLWGQDGADRLGGGAGADRVGGGGGDDTLWGGHGHDRLWGSSGDDLLEGGTGNDTLRSGVGDDVLRGRSGNDVLEGGGGRDLLSGSTGDDRLSGEDGDDVLYGGAGNNWMSGGAGTDRFVFHRLQSGADLDRIADFTPGEDRLDLRALDLDGIARSGPLREDVLRIADHAEGLYLRADLNGDGAADLRILLLDCDRIGTGDLLL